MLPLFFTGQSQVVPPFQPPQLCSGSKHFPQGNSNPIWISLILQERGWMAGWYGGGNTVRWWTNMDEEIKENWISHKKRLFFLREFRPRWWFQIFFIFTPIPGEMIQFDEHIFQMDWFIRQLATWWPMNVLFMDWVVTCRIFWISWRIIMACPPSKIWRDGMGRGCLLYTFQIQFFNLVIVDMWSHQKGFFWCF